MGDDRAYLGDESMGRQEHAYAYKSSSIPVLAIRMSIPQLTQNAMSERNYNSERSYNVRWNITVQCCVPIVEGASDDGGRRRRGVLAAHSDAQSRARREAGAGEEICHAERLADGEGAHLRRGDGALGA